MRDEAMEAEGLAQYSPQSLAYLGDAVFELLVRDMILAEGNEPANRLHQRAKQYVSAAAQSRMYFKIYDQSAEDEQAVLRRGRNAKTASKAKNATVSDYQHATGLEALFGYLFLKADQRRIMEIFNECVRDERGAALYGGQSCIGGPQRGVGGAEPPESD